MAAISNGIYAISRSIDSADQFLMLPTGDAAPGRGALLRPETGRPGESRWEVRAFSRRSVVICNVEHGIFLGFPPGDPEAGALVGGWPKPREWRLEPAGAPSEFLIVASGRRSGDLALGLDPGSADPLRTALTPMAPDEGAAPWRFTRAR
ncbi:hypothetical protein HUT06_17595 [Actinomadura sp. NAK00032]|uniref:hypothetical protein n=1 Tax=Actinomadura sp. NAK00032 TaxID=2742128 RepID=UPI0015923E67|nr:hypothetical protein [Actinomadura sp. NAK00032]QKW35630.1 hypothetical protein HUT06_17595 [Actinomadura sp. NAK00032]